MHDPFAPIDGGSGGGRRDDGKPQLVAVMPVPADAPAAPARHPKLGAPSASWTYRNATGAPIGTVNRFDGPDGKQFRPLVLFRPAAGGPAAWRWESWPAPRPLYGLDRLAARPAAPVVLTEGEKSADAAGRLCPDHVAVASPNGSKSAGKADWSALAGRHVTIWPDADEAGTAYAAEAEGLIREAGAASVTVLPSLAPAGAEAGWDAADALAAGWDVARAATALQAARKPQDGRKANRGGKAAPAKRRPSEGSGEDGPAPQRRRPQRDCLADLAQGVPLWRAPDRTAYGTLPIAGHTETWPIRSAVFKDWLTLRADEDLGVSAGSQALDDAMRLLEARANAYGELHKPWKRVGERDGRVYLDLCDDDWRAVEIGPDGWRVLERHGLPFVRSPAMRALPEPVAGQEIGAMRRFVNVASDEDFTLVVAWLVQALRPTGPYPILAVNGEQGSGKSVFTRLLRGLVDPNEAPIRAAPKEDRDLLVSAKHNHVLALDNLSKVEPWLADALCRLATGGGFATRSLHTNDDEHVLTACRPIVLNGIPMLTERPDLAERTITVRLSTIAKEERQSERQFWAEWEAAEAGVLGTLCDAISTALRRLPDVHLTSAPRLADFAHWAAAAEPGLGFEEGTFLAAYDGNHREVTDATFEADAVAVAIRDFMDAECLNRWEGTATELLGRLTERATESVKRSRSWPQQANALGNRLERVAPMLRDKGITVETRHSGTRTIVIARLDR